MELIQNDTVLSQLGTLGYKENDILTIWSIIKFIKEQKQGGAIVGRKYGIRYEPTNQELNVVHWPHSQKISSYNLADPADFLEALKERLIQIYQASSHQIKHYVRRTNYKYQRAELEELLNQHFQENWRCQLCQNFDYSSKGLTVNCQTCQPPPPNLTQLMKPKSPEIPKRATFNCGGCSTCKIKAKPSVRGVPKMSRPGDWRCGCSAYNFASRTNCFKCNQPRKIKSTCTTSSTMFQCSGFENQSRKLSVSFRDAN